MTSRPCLLLAAGALFALAPVTGAAKAVPVKDAKSKKAKAPPLPPKTPPEAQDRAYPAQSTVAAKGSFGTVAAADPALSSALDAKDLDGAAKLAGKSGAFQGTVSKVYSPADHDIVVLDFDPNYRSALTAVLKPDRYARFPDLQTLAGKHVLVSGKFVRYREKTQIELSDPAQIKIVP